LFALHIIDALIAGESDPAKFSDNSGNGRFSAPQDRC
jgi:hypothetical protein